MRFVTKFLIMLLLGFVLSFCSFGGGVVYADTGFVSFPSGLPDSLSLFDDSAYTVNRSLVFTTPSSSRNIFLNTFPPYYVGRYSGYHGFTRFGSAFSVPVSAVVDLSSRNWSDCTFVYNPAPVLGYDYSDDGEPFYEMITPSYGISGTVNFSFSDGSSQSFSFSGKSLSFSVQKDNFSNEYIMTSEDFNLKTDESVSDSQFGLNAQQAVSISSDIFQINASIVNLASGINTFYVKKGGSYLPDTVDVDSLVFYQGGMIGSGGEGSFDSHIIIPTADLVVTTADIMLSKGIVEPSLVTLDKASPDILLTGFTFSGNIAFYVTYSSPLPLPAGKTSATLHLGIQRVFNFNSSASVGGDILASIIDLQHYFRYELPLLLRHLIIPTSAEVSDVIDEAVEDIKDNAGGLGEAVKAVDNDIKQFQTILAGGKAGSLKIPGATVNVNGQKYVLWTDFDVTPYFKLKPVQDVISYVVPFLQFLIAGFVIYQLYYMWISILSGNSYFAYLKNIPSLNDDEGD